MTNLSGANLNNGAAVGSQGEGKENPSRFPKYPAYKDSGVEWLGEVPEGWILARGDAYLRSQAKVVSADYLGGKEVFHYSIPAVQATGDGQLEDGDEIDSSKLLVEQPQVLISKLNPRKNTVCLAGPREVVTVCSGEFVPLQSDCMDLKWVYYLVSSENFKKRLESLVESATRSHQRVNPSDILKFRGAFPLLAEQTQIARFLDHETARIDALIEEQQRLIELLKEKRQAVISHAVTKGLDPTAPMKDSGVEWLGEVPAHWEVTKFKWPLRTASGGTPPSNDRETYYDGEIPWLRSLDLTDDLVTEYEVSVTKKAIEETSCKIVPKNSVLIAMYGGDGTIGKNGLLTFDSAINQAICAFLPSGRCLPGYLHRYIQFYRPYWMIGAESSRKDPNIGQDRIGDHFLLLPPLEEQQEIVAFVSAELLMFTALVDEAQIGVELLQERRSALISAAVTGKIDVRNWQPPAGQYPAGDTQNRTEPEAV